MLLLAVLAVLALAPAFAEAPPAPAAPSADIVTERVVVPAPADVAAVLSDLARYAIALPPACIGRFVAGTPATGKGARARLRYDMGAMHRTLEMTLSRLDVEDTRAVVDFDHASNRGFVSRWFLDRQEDGTHVKVTTAMNPPPWPFTKYYFDAVKPEWDACQGQIVDNVVKLAGGGA
jgi:hypothetical protein